MFSFAKDAHPAPTASTLAPFPTPAPAVADTPLPFPVEPACERKDVSRIADLGLGRGLDATNPKPWMNKSSFHVRRICSKEVVETNEGGILQRYVNEIDSTRTQVAKMKLSVTYPQSPLSIGVDGELSRTKKFSSRSVGQKVVNRTVHFRGDMDDVPLTSYLAVCNDPETDCKQLLQKVSDECSQHCATAMPIFEERLARWICTWLQRNPEQSTYPRNCLERLSSLQKVVAACLEFVYHFRITHYVTGIELGAAEYVVMSSQQYQRNLASKVKLGVDKIADTSANLIATRKRSQLSSKTRKIGTFNSDNVTVSRDGEAVVGIKTHPISRLVKIPILRLTLQLVLEKYIEQATDDMGKLFSMHIAARLP